MTILNWVPVLRLLNHGLTLGELIMGLTGCILISGIGLLMMIKPDASYEWFVVKAGRDQFRRFSPERGPFLRLFHQCGGAIMFLGGLGFTVLLIFGA